MSIDRLRELIDLEREVTSGMSKLIGYMMGALKAINEDGGSTTSEHIAELAGKIVEESESRWKEIIDKRSNTSK